MSAPPLGAHQRLTARDLALLVIATLALVLPGLSRLPPVDRDESRYAQATSQMLQTRDFVDVRFQDQPRYLQPAGIYWLQAASVSLVSSPQARQIWAYRLPSTVAAVLSVVATAWIGAMLFGRAAGVGAGLLMAISLLLGFEARMAKIDATLLLTVLLSQGALLRLYLSRDAAVSRPRATAALYWIALGAGLMLKGPIICLVSLGTIVALGVTERRWRWLGGLRAGWGVPLMLAVAAPWFVAIGLKTHGAFFTKAVGHNLLGKVGAGEQAHGSPPGYYLALFTLTFWPGSLAVAASMRFAWRERATPAVRFLLAWLIPTWILYELIATKLPHYALPFYPALACLAAGAAVAAPRPGGRGWRIAGAAYGGVWVVVSLLIVCAPVVLASRNGVSPTPLEIGLAAAAGVLACGTALLLWRGARGPALATAGAAALAFAVNAYALTLPRIDAIWLSPRIVAAARRLQPCPGPALDFSSSAFSAPSLVFLSGGTVRLVSTDRAAVEMVTDRACRLALVERKQLAAFQAGLAPRGLASQAVGEVKGIDYSTGHKLDLIFLKAAPVSPAR